MRLERLGICFLGLVLLISACGRNIDENHHPFDEEEAAEINLQLGVEYMRRGRNDIALNRLTKALKLNDNYADAHNAIAVLYERLGLNADAQRHYQRAIALKPNNSDIHNNYGQFLCKQQQWEEANQAFLTALENPVYQTPEIPYTNAGLCALNHHNLNQAETYFRQALQSNPKFAQALYQMAQLNYEQKHYHQARDYLTRYESVAPDAPETLWLGIRLARELNKPEVEVNYAHRLRQKFPDAVQTQLLNRSE
jgi:type IV pilus assembly protein PilF